MYLFSDSLQLAIWFSVLVIKAVTVDFRGSTSVDKWLLCVKPMTSDGESHSGQALAQLQAR